MASQRNQEIFRVLQMDLCRSVCGLFLVKSQQAHPGVPLLKFWLAWGVGISMLRGFSLHFLRRHQLKYVHTSKITGHGGKVTHWSFIYPLGFWSLGPLHSHYSSARTKRYIRGFSYLLSGSGLRKIGFFS